METGLSVNDFSMRLPLAAAFHLDLFQFVERGEGPIRQLLVSHLKN
jgi:hypothetical protein